MSKSEAQRTHAARRFAERYGVALTEELHRQLVAQITQQRAAFVEKQSTRLSLWDVEVVVSDLDGSKMKRTVRVVFDWKRMQIVSALPPGVGGHGDWSEHA